jgi:frataxin-like iron-binding protein CyaY
MFILRYYSKKVRVPTNNVKQSLEVIIPNRVTHLKPYFEQLSTNFHSRITSALQKFGEMNDAPVITNKTAVSITMPKEGDFSVSFDNHKQELTYFSPISGHHVYFYEPVNDRWICERNGHLFEDLFIREFLNIGQGYIDL